MGGRSVNKLMKVLFALLMLLLSGGAFVQWGA